MGEHQDRDGGMGDREMDDEVARRRAGRRGDGGDEDRHGASLEEMAEEDGELFPLGTVAGDPSKTLKSLIKAGTPTKLQCSLSKAAVPLTGGLMDFGVLGEALVTYEAGVVHTVPELGETQADGSRKLKGVKLVQELRSVHVRPAEHLYTLGQVLEILEAHFGVPRSAEKVAEVFGLERSASA